MKTADQRWEDMYSRVKTQPKNNVNHAVFKEAMRPQNYEPQARMILERFPDLKNISIMEIGCGFGGLCKTIHRYVTPKSYTVVDNPDMLDFATETLENLKNINYIKAPQIETINWSERKYDILISNYCISETPREYQDYVFEKIFPVCGNIFMLDGDKKCDYPDRLNTALGENFKHVVKEGYKLDWRVDLYVAKYNKKMEVE